MNIATKQKLSILHNKRHALLKIKRNLGLSVKQEKELGQIRNEIDEIEMAHYDDSFYNDINSRLDEIEEILKKDIIIDMKDKANNTKEFARQDLLDMGLPHDPPKGGKIISNEIDDTTRWSELRTVIVQFPEQVDTDEAWSFQYSQGLTEYQNESPWEFEDTVTGILVKKQQKLVTVWE